MSRLVSVRLPDEQVEELQALGGSRTEHIVAALDAYLAEPDPITAHITELRGRIAAVPATPTPPAAPSVPDEYLELP